MTWKLTAWGKTRAGVTGVPWRDLSDAEYEQVAGKFPAGALEVYFEKEPIALAEELVPEAPVEALEHFDPEVPALTAVAPEQDSPRRTTRRKA